MGRFDSLTEHDVAWMFRWVAWSIQDTKDARALRSVSRKAVRGYDCAVHAGWLALAGHRGDVPDDEGATYRWVKGWFPVSFRLLIGPPPPTYRDAVHVVARFEHHMVVAEGIALHDIRRLWLPPPCTQLVLCETLDPPTAENVLEVCVAILAPPALHFRPARLTTAATTTMPDCLLMQVHSLTHFDSRGLEGLREIGRKCFCSCTDLTSIDGAGFCAVESVGFGFAQRCIKLSKVHLPHMPKLRTIHASFLSECRSLVTFDTTGLGSVTSIGGHFMTHCAALVEFDASGLCSVTQIGDRFLADASSLVSFNGDGLRSLETIGHSCLRSCLRLQTFRADGMQRVRQVGPDLLLNSTPVTSDAMERLVVLSRA